MRWLALREKPMLAGRLGDGIICCRIGHSGGRHDRVHRAPVHRPAACHARQLGAHGSSLPLDSLGRGPGHRTVSTVSTGLSTHVLAQEAADVEWRSRGKVERSAQVCTNTNEYKNIGARKWLS